MLKKPAAAAQVAAVLAGAAFVSSTAFAATAVVRNGDDSGPGSLREALASGADRIVIRRSVRTIGIDSTLTYDGTAPLTIVGGGATIEAGGDFTLLEITQGADLSIKRLHFVGIGGFSVENQSTGRGKGVFIDIPIDSQGTVELALRDVSVSGVAYHGVHVSDCDLGDDCGSGQLGDGKGSPAGVHVELDGVEIFDVGYGVFDGDGMRVDERDGGEIRLKARNVDVIGVGADGIELDETGGGDVTASIRNSRLDGNGGYCDPDLFDEDDLAGFPDPLCTAEGELDVDDAFDIDEGGDGSIRFDARNLALNGNFDEGLDLDEAGDGDILLDLANVGGELNKDEVVKASEEDAGDIVADLRTVKAIESFDNDGIELEETGAGDLVAGLRSVVAKSCDGSGIEIVQVDDGDLDVVVKGSVATDNGSDDLKVESDDTGTLKVRGSSIDSIGTEGVDEI